MLEIEIQRVSFVQFRREMRRQMFRNGQAQYGLQQFKEVPQSFPVIVIDVFYKCVTGPFRIISPSDMIQIRESAIDDAPVHFANRNLKTQILIRLLREIKPAKSYSTHAVLQVPSKLGMTLVLTSRPIVVLVFSGSIVIAM